MEFVERNLHIKKRLEKTIRRLKPFENVEEFGAVEVGD